MGNTKTKSMINYTYTIGDQVVHGAASSNYVEPFIREVIISIKKECNKQYFKPGDVLTYSLVLTNIGSYLAEFININEEILYQTLILDSIRASAIGEIDFAYQEAVSGLDFTIQKLEPHESVHIIYQTIVNELISHDFNISSVSEIEIDDQDLIYSNAVEIAQRYARVIIETTTDEFVYPNREYSYNLTASNVGNCIADDVELSMQLPSRYALSYIMVEDDNIENFTIDNNILKFFVGAIDVNEIKNINVTGKISK
jgi:hypothetical protein